MMVSAFVSREFGIGLGNLTDEDYLKINTYREGKEYTIPECADLVGIPKEKSKTKLKEDPSVEFFDYGKNNDGYWRSEHMAIQLEDTVDCLRAIHGDTYDFIGLFDWSSGHAKALSDGLKASDMSVSYGGKQTSQRLSMLIDDSCFGSCQDKLSSVKVGETFSHVFDKPTANGPMWMMKEEQEFHKTESRGRKYMWKTKCQIIKALKDKFTEMPADSNLPDVSNRDSVNKLRYLAVIYNVIEAKELKACEMKENEKPLTHQEMVALLSAENADTNGNTRVLRRKCEAINLPTTKIVKSGHVESWWSKPKGLAQICLERGLISLEKYFDKKYTKTGIMKKCNGVTTMVPGSSYIELLHECTDFKNEQSILGKVAEKYGMEIWFTPKYHCELAGEGIEYLWGYAKRCYRRIPAKAKKSKKAFDACVRNVCSSAMIGIERVRRFSRRARRYICSYFVMHDQMAEGDVQMKVNLEKIEDLVKQFKTHRCALDFDKKFIEFEDEIPNA